MIIGTGGGQRKLNYSVPLPVGRSDGMNKPDDGTVPADLLRLLPG